VNLEARILVALGLLVATLVLWQAVCSAFNVSRVHLSQPGAHLRTS
jgi:ABC-type nitrate/sulfonate/bicarbonate transport system permease component